MDDAEADPGRHARVDGVAPRFQDAVRGESGQRMARRDRMLRAERVGAEHVRGGGRASQALGRSGGAGTRLRGAATMLARRPV